MQLITLDEITDYVSSAHSPTDARTFAAEQPVLMQYMRQFCPKDTDFNSMLMGAITMYSFMRYKEACDKRLRWAL